MSFSELIELVCSVGWLMVAFLFLRMAVIWLKDSEARFVERKRQERKQLEQGIKNVLEEARRQGFGVRMEIKSSDCTEASGSAKSAGGGRK